jgi:hypothetical protein
MLSCHIFKSKLRSEVPCCSLVFFVSMLKVIIFLFFSVNTLDLGFVFNHCYDQTI